MSELEQPRAPELITGDAFHKSHTLPGMPYYFIERLAQQMADLYFVPPLYAPFREVVMSQKSRVTGKIWIHGLPSRRNT